MKGKIVRNGLFKVYPSGEIYKKKNGQWEKAHIGVNKIRNSKYQLVSTMENSKQVTAYVSRLMAEAFVPNPENKPNVVHLDGDSSNDNIDNLAWMTHKERAQTFVDMGRGRKLEDAGKPCIICGELTVTKDGICPKCKNNKKLYKKQLEKLEIVREKFRDVKMEHLSKRDRIIVEMRMKGKTLQEIGDRLGITRERVRQMEVRILGENFDLEDISVKELIGRNEININEIKKTRNMISKSKMEMAVLLGVSQTNYTKMEENPLIFRVEHILKLEKVLDIKINIR